MNFKKSSFSPADSHACVEVAIERHGIYVRDSKQEGKGSILNFTYPEWEAFLAGVKAGEFNLSSSQ